MADVFRESLDSVPDLPALCSAYPNRFPYLLHSAAEGGLGQYSLLLFAIGQPLTATPGQGSEARKNRAAFFAELERRYTAESCPSSFSAGESEDAESIPFTGGWFLYLGYEMVSGIEPTLDLPTNECGLPDAIAHRCPGAIIVEHGEHGDRAWVMAETRFQLQQILESLDDPRVKAARRIAGEDRSRLEHVEVEDPAKYENSVKRIQQYLAAGDVFQVNVSRRWNGHFDQPIEPLALYDSLCRNNPAPFAGMMHHDGRWLLSSSPERLVQTGGGRVQTRPIAGTRPRGGDERNDDRLSIELISNLKERAEHVMLIDLERNDLGRVCKPGSVEVNELMVVESYAHVHHIVSNVRGLLRSDAGPVDAIRACFPGGTITGCPKVRCMEIIAELEGEGRGFYTGSLGYLGRDGRMDLNILIRSLLLDDDEFSFRTGAGIVMDSEPEQEVQETNHKARGMLLAVQSVNQLFHGETVAEGRETDHKEINIA